MALFKVFDVSGSGMSAQSVRLNATASNLANANSASGSAETAYRAKHPVFETVLGEFSNGEENAGVRVNRIVESQEPARKEYAPNNPLADEEGYVYMPNVSAVEEMANMLSASRSYQSNIEVMNTTKRLLLQTLRMGQ